MASLGQELKRERELRGISLKDIANSTKISLRLLVALEEDRFDILPGEFFTRSIIRAYAGFIGLDEEDILNNYLESVRLREKAFERDHKEKKPPILIKNMTVIRFAVVFLIVFLLVFFFYFLLGPRNERTVAGKTGPPPEAVEKQTPPLLPPTPETIEETEEEKGLILELSFAEKTWIQVYADGELVLDGLKQRGERADLKAVREFLIHLGNAGGVRFTLNGREGKPFGRSGAVVNNIRITEENRDAFLVRDEEEKTGVNEFPPEE